MTPIIPLLLVLRGLAGRDVPEGTNVRPYFLVFAFATFLIYKRAKFSPPMMDLYFNHSSGRIIRRDFTVNRLQKVCQVSIS